MENSKSIILVIGLIFIFIFLTGFWVRSDGKPYSSIILTIHKLISLAAGVALGIALFRLNQAAGLSSQVLTVVLVSGVLFVITVLSGGIWSIEKEIPMVVLRLHRVSPFLTALSTGVMLYLVI
jgi:hypothetical protein